MLDVGYRAGEIYLSRIEIHPGNQGHGTRIVSALVEEAESARARTRFSTCSRATAARKALYRRLGLTEMARHGGRGTKVTMRSAIIGSKG